MAGPDLRFGAAVGLNAANPDGAPSHIYLLVGVQRPAGQCAGDDGATALRGKDPIDPQAWTAVVGGYGSRADELVESIAEIVETESGRRAHSDNSGVGQEGVDEPVAHVHLLQRQPLVADQICLRESNDPVAEADELEDPQMFLALRLPAFAGVDHEHARVDAADAGEHVAKEANVARYVNEADAGTAGKRRVGKAEIDRHAAAAFFFQAVRIGARQRLNQR